MNDILNQLRVKNPNITLYSVMDQAFESYGQVLSGCDTASLAAVLQETRIPESGNHYEASVSALEALPVMAELRHAIYGGMPIQAGFCNGHGFKLNAEEYHKCSEINYSTTGLVLLLAKPECLKNNRLDSRDVQGFYLPPNVLIEIYPRVLHFAPCRISPDGFNCLVILERSTNAPLECQTDTDLDRPSLLWAKNKWLICHTDSPQAQNGAFAGICGDNLELHI